MWRYQTPSLRLGKIKKKAPVSEENTGAQLILKLNFTPRVHSKKHFFSLKKKYS
jgi:hypothetical protein